MSGAWQYNLNVTRRCNLRCPHCFIEPAKLAGGGDMSLSVFLRTAERIAEQLAGTGRSARVQILGGEPLLLEKAWWEESLSGMRRILSEAGVPHHVKAASNLASARADDPRTLLLFDGVSTSWDEGRFPDRAAEARWEERVGRLAAAGRPPGVEVTVTRRLAEEGPEGPLTRILGLGVEEIHFSPFIPRTWIDDLGPEADGPGSAKGGLAPTHEASAAFLKALADLRLEILRRFPKAAVHPVDSLAEMLAGGSDPLDGGCSEFSCPIHTGVLNVDWDGRASSCTNDGCDGADEFVGNVLDDSFAEILTRPKARRRRREAAMPHRTCSSCPRYAVCAGGCSLLHRFWNGEGECPGTLSFIERVAELVQDGVLPAVGTQPSAGFGVPSGWK